VTNIPVFILLAGQNSRFFPFNSRRSKTRFELLGRSFLERTLQNLLEHGFREITFIVSPREDVAELDELITRFAELHVTIVSQPEALGMGDAVLRSPIPDDVERVAIISGYHWHAGAHLTEMAKQGSGSILSLTTTDRPSEYGIVRLSEGFVREIVEKPAAGTEPSNLKIQSLYVLERDFFETLRATPMEQYSFETALNAYCQDHSVLGYEHDALATLKYPWDLLDRMSDLFLEKRTSIHTTAKVSQTAVIDDAQGPVIIDEGASIGHASRIVGPCYIGRQASVGDFNLIRGSSLEAHVSTGPYTEIARSIVGPHSSIHRGYLGDSILEDHVQIGAGFISANKRFDRQPVPVVVKGQKVSSKRTGLGVMIGRETSIGVSSHSLPGVAIGAETLVFPGAQIAKNIEHKQRFPARVE
jgi:UDP-N-acetylglucosamine diphosphorylase / glucose-1-phosphate thymidylyltransferase / UDP-N-acetylgalactosamine diphosphorylase / glucosamine-1-phosphate N-acetyltransferase / galactosamine-1-phosphate N-acetyltransferase